MSADVRSIWCWAGVRSMGSVRTSSAATGAEKGEVLGISALRGIRAPLSHSHRTELLGSQDLTRPKAPGRTCGQPLRRRDRFDPRHGSSRVLADGTAAPVLRAISGAGA